MPTKMKVERPGFNKFRLEELGLNITENPGSVDNNRTRTYSDKSSSSHGHGPSKGATVSLIKIKKDRIPLIGMIYFGKVAVLPMSMGYVKDKLSEIIVSGRNSNDTYDSVVKKISRRGEKYTAITSINLVESWFRNASDKRISGADVIDLSEICYDLDRAEEMYTLTNTTLPFFSYLSDILGMAIEVRV
jgi:hypothetical protein